MKLSYHLTLLLALACSVKSFGQTEIKTKNLYQNGVYDTREGVKCLARFLNESVPEFKRVKRSGFQEKNEKPQDFFVYDLTDTVNNTLDQNRSIEFTDGHVYHFALKRYPYDLSHIAYLESGVITVFKSINCQKRGDSLEKVLNHLGDRLGNSQSSENIKQRIRNHRRYGIYYKIDSMAKSICK